MAIWATIALRAAGKDPKKTLVAGIDATREALDEMRKANLKVTDFQDTKVRRALQCRCQARQGQEGRFRYMAPVPTGRQGER
jgi:hypothetical protein